MDLAQEIKRLREELETLKTAFNTAHLPLVNGELRQIVATKITEDSTHRFATDTEKSAWDAKAETGDIDAAIAEVPTLSTIVVHEGDVVTHEGEVVWVN